MSELANLSQDPWTLTLGRPVVPAPSDDAFQNRERRADCAHLPITRVDDAVWPLHHLVHADDSGTRNIRFDDLAPEFRKPARIYLYNALNTPPQRLAVKMTATLPAPTSIHAFMASLRHLTAWMSTQRLTFPQMTAETWNAYAHEVASISTGGRGYKKSMFLTINRLWAHNADLPEPYRFAAPPWFGTTFNRWLGPHSSYPENRTEPLESDLVADLMHASLTLIGGYIDGTVTLGSRRKHWKTEARAWAIDQGLNVPSRGGVTAEQGHAWKRAKNWAPPFDKGDVRAACFIVISYLTGMRPQEVLHLERDCLTVEPGPDALGSSATQYRIRARVFKHARDTAGNTVGAGRERKQPWVTIAPAVSAIEALRRLSPNERYLFALYKRTEDRQRRGDIVPVSHLSRSLDRFITKWNRHASHDGRRAICLAPRAASPNAGSGAEMDILDTEITSTSTVSPSQFRRTLAWHIANQPGGEVALGVQYGHLKTVISLGYAGRAASGFPDESELDALLANWGRLEDFSTEVHDGSAISGTAAPRVREALSHFADHFEGQVRTEAELKRFKAAGLHLIHDNPQAHNVCAYNSALALCHPDRQRDADRQTPDLSNCQRGCPNIALLDSHAGAKATTRLALLEEAEYLPTPLAERSRTIAADLQRDTDRHQTAKATQKQALRNEDKP